MNSPRLYVRQMLVGRYMTDEDPLRNDYRVTDDGLVLVRSTNAPFESREKNSLYTWERIMERWPTACTQANNGFGIQDDRLKADIVYTILTEEDYFIEMI